MTAPSKTAQIPEWLTPFDGSGIEWHESLPSPYTYQESDFCKLVAAVHEYECEVLRLRETLGDWRRKPKPDGGQIHA